MSRQSGLAELDRRRALAEAMGGEAAIARHRSRGKLTARERIARLCDPGSFVEIGAVSGVARYDEHGGLASFSPANFLFGRARIDGRPVVITADDFTIRGGAADGSIRGKLEQAERMAWELGLPMVRLIDATGGSVKTVEAMGRTYVPANPAWGDVVRNLESVPVVSLVLGSVAGYASARAVSSHLTVMVAGTTHMFIAGPPVVKRAGIDIDKDALGGPQVHEKAGAADLVVASEDDAFAAARRFLTFLPSCVGEAPPTRPGADPEDRAVPALRDVVPVDRRQIYAARPILDQVFDDGDVFEMAPKFGRATITALARLGGRPVAVLASDPRIYGGAWDVDTSEKVIRFLDFAETFRLPIVHFVDIPGFMIGPAAEQAGTIRKGARALAAVYRTSVPVCAVIMRKCFGVAGAGHMNPEGFRERFAWPSGDWGSIPPEGGIEAAYRRDLDEAEDRAALLAEISARLELLRSPFRTAEAFGVEDIVDPAETRVRLCAFAALAHARVMRTAPQTRYRP
jgi:acetyl-CoA carboxylase carboxyltransferase component